MKKELNTEASQRKHVALAGHLRSIAKFIDNRSLAPMWDRAIALYRAADALEWLEASLPDTCSQEDKLEVASRTEAGMLVQKLRNIAKLIEMKSLPMWDQAAVIYNAANTLVWLDDLFTNACLKRVELVEASRMDVGMFIQNLREVAELIENKLLPMLDRVDAIRKAADLLECLDTSHVNVCSHD